MLNCESCKFSKCLLELFFPNMIAELFINYVDDFATFS